MLWKHILGRFGAMLLLVLCSHSQTLLSFALHILMAEEQDYFKLFSQ